MLLLTIVSLFASLPGTGSETVVDTTVVTSETYAYDAAGRLTRVTLGDGSHVTYAYDPAGNVLSFVAAANQAPGPFVRLLPEDGTLTHSDTLRFAWSTAVDPEGSDVVYTLVLSVGGLDSTVVTPDTSVAIDLSMRALPEDVLEVHWSVEASDGFLSVGPSNGEGFFILDRTMEGTYVDPTLKHPHEYALYPAYPNPFNPVTTIRFDAVAHVHVRLRVYDLLGRVVATLVDGPLPPGRHQVLFQGAGFPSGLYVYTIQMGDFRDARTVMLVK